MPDVVVATETLSFVLPPDPTTRPVVDVTQHRTVIVETLPAFIVVQEPVPLIIRSGPPPITIVQEVSQWPT